MRPLRIHTVCWGALHFDWLERALFKSMSWEKNRAAIQHAIWMFYTMPGDQLRAEELLSGILPKDQIQVLSLLSLIAKSKALPDPQNFLFHGLLTTMHECLADGSQMLMAPPDTIFGEGSVQGLLELAEQPDTCVAVPHPRVLPSILDDVNGPVSNADLVSLVGKHAHQAWSEADASRDLVNSYVGGLSWRRLSSGLIAVTHHLPTVYVANFRPEDLTFFLTPPNNMAPRFGLYDWEWPGICLTPNGRQRTVGSSDVAMILEITNPDTNVPSLRPANPFHIDAFCKMKPHNIHNRQNVTIFRPTDL